MKTLLKIIIILLLFWIAPTEPEPDVDPSLDLPGQSISESVSLFQLVKIIFKFFN